MVNSQILSIKDPLTGNTAEGMLYQNLYCQHFVGFSATVFQLQKCPICQVKIMINPNKANQINLNRLLMILRDSFLCRDSTQFEYYLRENVFKLKETRSFTNFAHFVAYYKIKHNIKNRFQNNILLKYQKIPLCNKFWGKKYNFTQHEMIQYPVRGKYCKHIQFYDLLRVFDKYLQNPQKDSFECFVCLQPVCFQQLIYLKQMEQVIKLAKQLFFLAQPSPQHINLQIDHHMRQVFLTSQMQKGFNKKKIPLQIYRTIMDPMSKSQIIADNWKQKSLNQSFSMFFFGH